MNIPLWKVGLLAALLSASLRAQEPAMEAAGPQGPPLSEAAGPEGPGGKAKRNLDQVARDYGVSGAEIQAMRDKGLGWGEVGHALVIAQKSGRPLSEILGLRESGMGWGKIARKYGLKLGQIKGKVKKVIQAGRRAERVRGGGRDKGPGKRPRGPRTKRPP